MSRTVRIHADVMAELTRRRAEYELAGGERLSLSDTIRLAFAERYDEAIARYEALTLDVLVSDCRDRGLLIVGNKNMLARRLAEDDWGDWGEWV